MDNSSKQISNQQSSDHAECCNGSSSRANRFSEVKSLRQRREEHMLQIEADKKNRQPKNIIQGDYNTRGMDYCYYCGDKFNVGEKIPRILVHCGHTFCTECLQELRSSGHPLLSVLLAEGVVADWRPQELEAPVRAQPEAGREGSQAVRLASTAVPSAAASAENSLRPPKFPRC